MAVNPRSLCMSPCRTSLDRKRQITFGMKKFLCFRIREHGDKAKSIWTHLDDSASEWSSFLGRRFLPLGSPASAVLFRTPALPELHRSPSEAPVSQSNCRLLIGAAARL